MFILITLEGAFRKWISTDLTFPLVAARDLIALATIIYAVKYRFITPNRTIDFLLIGWMFLVTIWGLFQLLLGVSNPIIFLIGLRFWCLYIGFGFAVGKMITKVHVLKIVRLCLWTAILMTPIAISQFLSPRGAFINTQLDGDESTVFTAAMGIVRVTGTFSFTYGYYCWLGLVTPLILWASVARQELSMSSRFSLVGLAALIVCTSVSGSRGTIVTFIAIFLASAFAALWLPGRRQKENILLISSIATIFVVFITFLLPNIVLSMNERFSSAARDQTVIENIFSRIFETLSGGDAALTSTSWIGSGIGLGNGLSAQLLVGEQLFLAGEFESGRILIEGGLLGAAYLFIKILILFGGSAKAYILSLKTKSVAPAFIWIGFLTAFFGWSSIGQLTAHGYLGLYVALAVFLLRPTRCKNTVNLKQQ